MAKQPRKQLKVAYLSGDNDKSLVKLILRLLQNTFMLNIRTAGFSSLIGQKVAFKCYYDKDLNKPFRNTININNILYQA
ncbi:MAG: hypothetical protein JWR87_3041 [Segetibacter sp.]|jgi:hypothetical protein|nr:hypothetical protein [Segetibacter sp.]